MDAAPYLSSLASWAFSTNTTPWEIELVQAILQRQMTDRLLGEDSRAKRVLDAASGAATVAVGWIALSALCFGLLSLPFMAMAFAAGGEYGNHVDAGLPLAVLRFPWEPLAVLSGVLGAGVMWVLRQDVDGGVGPPTVVHDPYRQLVDPWEAMPPDLRP